MSTDASSDAKPSSGQGAWRVVALLMAFSFMSWFNRVSMSVAYDTKIGPDLGVSEEKIGTVYSAFFFSYLLFMTPGGWFIDRFGPKRALLIMGLGSGLFGALTSCAGLPVVREAGLLVTALLVIRCAMGLVSAPLYPASARMISAWIPAQKRASANGLIQGSATIGMACAFPFFGAIIDAWDWPAAFVGSGIVTMILGFIWWLYAADRPATSVANAPEARHPLRSTEPASDWVALLLQRDVMLLTISYAAVGYLEYLFFFWMNHYFGKILGIEKSDSRNYTAILYLSMTVGMFGGGWLADRLRKSFGPWAGRALVPMAGMTLGAGFLVFGVLAEHIFWIVFWLSLALMAVGATEGPIWTAAVEIGGKQGGTVAGIVNTGGNFGGIIAPVLTPFVSHAIRDRYGLSEQAGWQWGIALAGWLCLTGAWLWWWIRPGEEHS